MEQNNIAKKNLDPAVQRLEVPSEVQAPRKHNPYGTSFLSWNSHFHHAPQTCAVRSSDAAPSNNNTELANTHTSTTNTMAIPDSIIEATEKGMVGENLLCSSVPSMEKTTSTHAGAEKPDVLTRAEEASKSTTSVSDKRRTSEGHVKFKGVDV